MRARRRAWVRDYAKNEWRNLKKTGKAWKVERFIALIGVACPSQKNIFPARAAETIKPIIDGGSDARLWDDVTASTGTAPYTSNCQHRRQPTITG